MNKDKFELGLLADASADILAWIVPAGRLFNWMTRSIEVPAGWLALGKRRGRDPLLVGSGKSYEDSDTEEIVFVRSGAVRCVADAADLKSSDGYAFSGTIEIQVRLIEDAAELGAFRRTIAGSSDVIRRLDLQRQLQWELHKALVELAGRHTAEELLVRLDSGEARTCVEGRLGGFFLSGGLALEGPVVTQFDSPAYREFRREQAHIESRDRRAAARARVQEALAQARGQRLSHLVEILGQLEQAAESRKDLSIADLLRTFGESERGEMYAALWHVASPTSRAAQVAAVSGQHLLLFAPTDLERPARQIRLPDSLGPLRSVATDERSREAQLLMVGARLGVHLVDLAAGEVVDSLSAAEVQGGVEVRGGVNASAMSEARVYATHSELGLLGWPRGMFNAPVEKMLPEVTSGADTVRSALFTEGQLWFSVDEEVWARPEETAAQPTLYAGARERVSALTVAAGVVYAGTICGQILSWDVGAPESGRVLRGSTGNPVETLALLDNGTVDHLLIADRGTALQALVLEDNYIRRYEAGNMSVRRAAATDDVFVAMNDNRDRLIAWDPREPARPKSVLIIPHLTGEPLQDLCIVSECV